MKNLFDIVNTQYDSLLPYDGECAYKPGVLSSQSAKYYLDNLIKDIPWSHDRLLMFGKEIVTKRKVAWYGDRSFKYTYSKVDKYALPWTDDLIQLKSMVEKEAGTTFNSSLLNLYHDGSEGMGWHADNEAELLQHGTIASLSLGETRKFVLKHRETKEKVEIYLESGSLLLMQGVIQDHWLHRLTTTTKAKDLRINLTFRTIVT